MKLSDELRQGAAEARRVGWQITDPILPHPVEKAATLLDELEGALSRLALACGEMPENGQGTVQGQEVNLAYSEAVTLLERLKA